MSSTEDSPTLQSMSIRALSKHLEDADHTVPSQSVKKVVSPRGTAHADDDTELTEASLADIQPRPITSFTLFSRSTLTTELNLHQVLVRIEKLIRDKSLKYTIDPENSSIELQTPCNLSFALYLWTNKHGKILVEVHRRSGCGILMQQVRRTLFGAFFKHDYLDEQQFTTKDNETWLQRCPLYTTVSQRIKDLMDQEHPEKNLQQEDIILQDIGICEGQLCSDRRDLHHLAMESLVHMTNPRICSPLTNLTVAQTILRDNESQDNHLHNEFVQTLRSSICHHREYSSGNKYLMGMATFQQEQCDKTMSILCLTVLYNAIKVAKTCGTGDCMDTSSYSWRRIAACLKDSLHDPEQHTQEAFIAARCIRAMEDLDNNASTLFAEDDSLVEFLTGETTRQSNVLHREQSSYQFY